MIAHREYQQLAVDSLWDYFGKHEGNPVIAMPTGTGKSVVIALILKRIFGTWGGQRIIIATHVKELIQQNYMKLMQLWPGAPAGIYSAGLGRKDATQRITFGGIASMAKNADLFGHVDLMFIDEAHLVSPTETTMYQAFIAMLRRANPKLKIVGLTATPWRLGHGPITEGSLFTDICFDMTGIAPFNWLIEEGYLVPLIPRSTATELKVDGVHMRAGEFAANELQMAVNKDSLTRAALLEMLELGKDRKSWLIFCSGIEHSMNVADMLTDMGVPCRAVHNNMSTTDRDATIKAFKSGELHAIANNNILTTGFDHPGIDLIGVLRPTASAVLWVQMLGRGTRPQFLYGAEYNLDTKQGRRDSISASGKQNCLVLDYARNTRRLGPINDPVIPRKKGHGGGDAPVKLCESCNVWNHASARVCFNCLTPFPEPQLKIQASATSDELIKVEMPQVEKFTVGQVSYSIHEKTGRPPMVRVDYYCGIRRFCEFVCFEHEGYAGKRAREWWRERSNAAPPATSYLAMESITELPAAAEIEVWVNNKFPQIMKHHFSDVAEKQGALAQHSLALDDDIPF